jgi:hypothetical protein
MIDLLPNKEFRITLKDGAISEGKYSAWALKRFTDKKGIGLKKLQEALTEDNISLNDLCLVVQCAVEHKLRESGKPFIYDDFSVCNWAEEMGGFESENWISLVNHANPEEKKSPVDQLSGQTLEESVFPLASA